MKEVTIEIKCSFLHQGKLVRWKATFKKKRREDVTDGKKDEK